VRWRSAKTLSKRLIDSRCRPCDEQIQCHCAGSRPLKFTETN
jgi:hypothetical protein